MVSHMSKSQKIYSFDLVEKRCSQKITHLTFHLLLTRLKSICQGVSSLLLGFKKKNLQYCYQHDIWNLVQYWMIKFSIPCFPRRKKLTQLQHAYTCLFRDYDSKLKSEVKTHLNFYLFSLVLLFSLWIDVLIFVCVCCACVSSREEICAAD